MKNLLQKFLFVVLLLGVAVLPSMPALTQDSPTGDNPSDPGVLPNGNLVPGYQPQFPSEQTIIVSPSNNDGELTTDAICTNMAWISAVVSDWVSTYYYRTRAYSHSRDAAYQSYPCDVDTIGARARVWDDSTLVEDTTMQYAYNSADKEISTAATVNCYHPIYQRGNHVYEKAGYGSQYPQTENWC